MRICTWLLFVVCFPAAILADGLADNQPESVRRVPKLGIDVPAAAAERLRAGLAELQSAMQSLETRDDPRIRELLPDVRIFHDAVRSALDFQELFDLKEIDTALELLNAGQERAAQLAEGNAPWTESSGLVVRGYVSRIDGSVQPYGLVVPASYRPDGAQRHRLDIWFHGRGETLSEVNFLQGRRTQNGQFTPADTLVLHPYGRYCNAFKFAGEVDVLEALEAVRRQYRIDGDRISVRGFSMGGAACWQFAVHYASRWFAANPGAGFSETPEFLRFFQKETLDPTWFERKLWRWYDCTDWAGNLYHCPTVAYSGEVDIQKQAADIMQQALAREGIDLVHVIGPQTGHSYHPEAAATVERLMGNLAEAGRERLPRNVHLSTYTLQYNRQAWVAVEGLGEHWERASVDARIGGDSAIEVNTSNVTDLLLEMQAGECPFDLKQPVRLTIDGQDLELPRPRSDRSWRAPLHQQAPSHRKDGAWMAGVRSVAGLRKRPGLQGPIDDAFMDSFLFVRPTGEPWNESVGAWAASELERAVGHWRRQFRGTPRVKDDVQVDEHDIAGSNLVLWGDPGSNALLARLADKLPIRWQADAIVAGPRSFPAGNHALIAVYPNPLNAHRYVVLNSSFTYRDFAYLNNARQVPKLPDWAVVDLTVPPNSLWPGKIAAADFFDEAWQLRPPR